VEVLEKRHGALAVALRTGWENLIPRALRMTDNGIDMGVTKLESGMSFLQVIISVTVREKLIQVRSARCMNQQEMPTLN
jgi:hypothetical protein